MWNVDGTSAYGAQHTRIQATPDSIPEDIIKWYEWNGASPDATLLKEQPTKAMIAPKVLPPVLPIALRTATLPLSASLAFSTPKNQMPAASGDAPDILHPLYLEATGDSVITAANSSRRALIAADAEKSYLLADMSAVLYYSGGSLYAVPLVRVKSEAYTQVKKTAAMENAKQVGMAILGYTQDYDGYSPSQAGFPEVLGSYIRKDTMFQGFSYISPGVPASVTSPGTTIMGFIAAPGGRAVVYVDGHVQWEDKP